MRQPNIFKNPGLLFNFCFVLERSLMVPVACFFLTFSISVTNASNVSSKLFSVISSMLVKKLLTVKFNSSRQESTLNCDLSWNKMEVGGLDLMECPVALQNIG